MYGPPLTLMMRSINIRQRKKRDRACFSPSKLALSEYSVLDDYGSLGTRTSSDARSCLEVCHVVSSLLRLHRSSKSILAGSGKSRRTCFQHKSLPDASRYVAAYLAVHASISSLVLPMLLASAISRGLITTIRGLNSVCNGRHTFAPHSFQDSQLSSFIHAARNRQSSRHSSPAASPGSGIVSPPMAYHARHRSRTLGAE